MSGKPTLWLAGLSLLLPTLPGQAQDLPLCSTVDHGISLDHVVIAVEELAEAEATYRGLGFTLKPGRLHANSIRNTHIKLPAYTDLELLTVEAPMDEMTRGYVDFLEEGDGGAFLALRHLGPLSEVVRKAEAVGEAPRFTAGRAFDYVSFPESRDLQHLFFIEYHQRPQDPDSLRRHDNGAVGIDKVWIQGTGETEDFLRSLSPRTCGVDRHPAGFGGRTVGAVQGHIVVVRPSPDVSRLRVLGVTLRAGTEALIDPTEAHGIWLHFVLPRPPR